MMSIVTVVAASCSHVCSVLFNQTTLAALWSIYILVFIISESFIELNLNYVLCLFKVLPFGICFIKHVYLK